MQQTQKMVTEICPTTTQSWVKRGAILVDVREANEVEELAFVVPNILHIPLSEFEYRFKELPFGKELVMVCWSGTRSLRAAAFLINNGYDPTKVVNMKLGMVRWAQKGFPTYGDINAVQTADTGCCGTPAANSTPEKDSCCGGTSDQQPANNKTSDTSSCC